MRVWNFLRFIAGLPPATAHELHPKVLLVALEQKVFAQHQKIIAEVLLDDRAVVDAAAIVFDYVDTYVEIAGGHFMLWSKKSDFHSLFHFQLAWLLALAHQQQLPQHSRDNKRVVGVELDKCRWINDIIIRRRYSLPLILLIQVHIDVGLLTIICTAIVEQRDVPVLEVICTVGELKDDGLIK